jgi:hypothetical protein
MQQEERVPEYEKNQEKAKLFLKKYQKYKEKYLNNKRNDICVTNCSSTSGGEESETNDEDTETNVEILSETDTTKLNSFDDFKEIKIDL